MNERKAVTREPRGEYHKAGKKEKGLILDQYVRLTGYNRMYAIRVLSTPPGKITTLVINGKTVVSKAEKAQTEKPIRQTYLLRGNRCLHRSHLAVLLVYVRFLSGGTHQTKY
jgi:hypothetical protein